MHEKTTLVQHNVAVSNANNIARIPPNPERVALIIGNPTAATIHWAFRQTPTALTGIPILADEIMKLSDSLYGTGIQDEIQVLCGGASVSVPYAEFICKCVEKQGNVYYRPM